MKNLNITQAKILSDYKHVLKKVTYEYESSNGEIKGQTREVYDRGDGATILLYNADKKTVILTKQFRLPTYLNGNKNGVLIEACAGKLDGEEPEDAVRRETEEETGYKITHLKKVFEAYTTPGSVTEMLHFYVAAYSEDMKSSEGGGLKEEGEDIEVLELDFRQACAMVDTGEIKDCKTIMLLQYAQIQRLLE